MISVVMCVTGGVTANRLCGKDSALSELKTME